MAIPTFDQMLHPILTLASRAPVTRQSTTEAMAQHFNLTDDERTAYIPSGGSTYVRHRVGWAMTDLTKSGLIEKCSPKTYRATAEGSAFLKTHTKSISVADLATLPAFQAWKKSL